MLLERIVYRDGWPTIRRNSPAVWQRPAPVT
jgi:hypothetical protein